MENRLNYFICLLNLFLKNKLANSSRNRDDCIHFHIFVTVHGGHIKGSSVISSDIRVLEAAGKNDRAIYLQ